MISRMAAASAALKGCCLLVVAAAVAFAATTEIALIALAAAALTLVFWALEAMYRRQERRFQRLYDEVRTEPSDQAPDFRIAPDAPTCAAESFAGAAASWSTALLCGPLIIFMIVVSLAV